MSRHSDEFEDRGRRRRDENEDRGRRDDDDDRRGGRGGDDDRGRGRDEYDDDAPPRRGSRERSGLITAMGVVHIIFGSLAVLTGLCLLIGGLLVSGAAADVGRVGGPGANAMGAVGVMAVLMAIVIMAAGGGGISGGIGTLSRKFWGWVLGLVAGGLSAVMGIFFFIGMINAFGIPSGIPGKSGAIVLNLFGFFIAIGYTVFVYIVSFQARVRAEFR